MDLRQKMTIVLAPLAFAVSTVNDVIGVVLQGAILRLLKTEDDWDGALRLRWC